eukprot:contig_2387_g452
MGRDVAVALLKTLVLLDPVQVLAADDHRAAHLGGHHHPAKQPAADGDITGEGTLLVNVVAVNGLSRGLDAQANVLVPAALLLRDAAGQRHGSLLLERLLMLDIHGEPLAGTSGGAPPSR